MITNNLRLVRKSVTKYASKIDVGSRLARDEMAATLVQLAKEEFDAGSTGKGKFQKDATPGGRPKVRSGNLRRSIIFQKYSIGFANYQAIIGPTMVYSRAVELGGKYSPRSWRGTQAEALGFPFMKPAWQKFRGIAPAIIRKHLG